MSIARRFCGFGLVFLVAASLAPAGAQPGWRSASDPKGLFTISLPGDWTAASSRMSDKLFRDLRRSGIGPYVISTFAAHSAMDDGGAPAILGVVAMNLPGRFSPAEFGEAFRAAPPSDWTVTQHGPAKIAGRDAYYIYFTGAGEGISLYGVMAYFTVGRTGFLVFGGTLNEPQAIRRHFSTISQILETFRPSSSLGGAPSKPGLRASRSE